MPYKNHFVSSIIPRPRRNWRVLWSKQWLNGVIWCHVNINILFIEEITKEIPVIKKSGTESTNVQNLGSQFHEPIQGKQYSLCRMQCCRLSNYYRPYIHQFAMKLFGHRLCFVGQRPRPHTVNSRLSGIRLSGKLAVRKKSIRNGFFVQ